MNKKIKFKKVLKSLKKQQDLVSKFNKMTVLEGFQFGEKVKKSGFAPDSIKEMTTCDFLKLKMHLVKEND